jgi:hypothetical protein
MDRSGNHVSWEQTESTTTTAMDGLTALGNFHFPPVAAPEPDILHEHQCLDFVEFGNMFVVLIELLYS